MNEKYLKYIGVAVLILAFIGLLYFLFSSNSQMNKPKPTLQVSVGNLTTSTLYEIKDGALQIISLIPEGSVLSRFRNHDIGVTLSVILPPNRLGNVLVFENEEGSRQLVNESSVKDTPSVSYDGAYVAYAELSLPFGSTLYSETINDWVINVFDISTGKVQQIDTGYAPYFAPGRSDVLLYSTDEGIVQFNLQTKEKELLYAVAFPDTTKTAKMSPNGMYMAAYNPLTMAFTVFSITGEFPFELQAIGEPAPHFEIIALSNDELFGVLYDIDTDTRTLVSVPFDAAIGNVGASGNEIFKFESDVVPYQIIP